MVNEISFWAYNAFLLLVGTFAVYVGIQELISKKALLMAGIEYSFKKKPIAYILVVAWTLICGIIALVYLIHRII